MAYSSQNKNLYKRITRPLPKHLPKPPFVVLIEKNFLLSKTNQTYNFPRLQQHDIEINEEDEETPQSEGDVYNLNDQNQERKQLNFRTLEVRQRTYGSTHSRRGKEVNLSVQRMKTDISSDEKVQGSIKIKLPLIQSKKMQLNTILTNARSISQTSIK